MKYIYYFVLIITTIFSQSTSNVDHSIKLGPLESYGYTPTPETFKIRINNSFISSRSYYNSSGKRISSGNSYIVYNPKGEIISNDVLAFDYNSDIIYLDVDYMNNELHGVGLTVPVYIQRVLNEQTTGMIGFGDYSLRWFIIYKPYDTFHIKSALSYNRSLSGYNMINDNHFKTLSRNSIGIEECFDLFFGKKLLISTKIHYIYTKKDSSDIGIVSPINFFDFKIQPIFRFTNNLSSSIEYSFDRYKSRTTYSGFLMSIKPKLGYRVLKDIKVGYFDLLGMDINISINIPISGERTVAPYNLLTSLNFLFK